MAGRKPSNIIQPPYAPPMARLIDWEVSCVVSSYLKGTMIACKSSHDISVPALLVAALLIAVGRESCCSETAGET